MLARGLRHRAPVLWLLVPYAAGVAGGKCLAWSGPASSWLGGALALSVLAWLLRRHSRVALALACLALVLTGFGRYVHARDRLADWDTLPARALHTQIKIERVFEERSPSAKPRLRGLGRLLAADDPGQELAGQRLAFNVALRRGQTAPPVGAVIEAVIVVRSLPYAPPTDSFEGYLAAQGVNFRAQRGHYLRTVAPPSWLEQTRQRLLHRFEKALSRGLESRPDVIAVYHGMLLGQVSSLREDQNRLFSETGTLHLFSVSGLHIGVVALALHTLLGALRFTTRARVLVLLPLVGAYVYITGASPAAVRAFGMVAFLEFGRAWRRPVNPLSALATTALISLVWAPLDLFSVSFQYSYAIVASLLLLGQPLAEAWQARWQPFERLPFPLWRPWHHAGRYLALQGSTALCLGLSAMLVGELCTLQYFHLLTPGGLVANLVLIPASSLAIVAGMVTLLLDSVGLGLLGVWFNQAAGVVICFIMRSLEPWHGFDATYARASLAHGWLGMLAFSALLALLLVGYHFRWQPRRWWLPTPFLAVALVLVFAVSFH